MTRSIYARRLSSLLILLCIGLVSLKSQYSAVDSTSIETAPPLEKKNSFTSIFYGQPGKAALYSLIVPGAGQIYNKRWWKAPLVWAGEGFLVYNLTQSINTFNIVDNCRTEIITSNTTLTCAVNDDGDPIFNNTNDAFTVWQAARSQRDQAWIFLSVGHLINVFEAFVDRHLINFDVSDNLSFSTQPDPFLSEFDQGSFRVVTPQIEILSLSISLNRHSHTEE